MSTRTPVYFDTEFILKPLGPAPLSLAFTSPGHAEDLYVVITDTDRTSADAFVQEFVLPFIDNEAPNARNIWCTADRAKDVILTWLLEIRSLHQIDFWANFCAHDWVTFTHLWGGDFNKLPPSLAHHCNDVQTVARWKGYTHRDLPDYEFTDPLMPPHHAMPDAYSVQVKHEWLVAH